MPSWWKVAALVVATVVALGIFASAKALEAGDSTGLVLFCRAEHQPSLDRLNDVFRVWDEAAFTVLFEDPASECYAIGPAQPLPAVALELAWKLAVPPGRVEGDCLEFWRFSTPAGEMISWLTCQDDPT